MKLTVKNIGRNPTMVRTSTRRRSLAHGESITDDFEDGEAANLSRNTAVFEVQGYKEPAPGKRQEGEGELEALRRANSEGSKQLTQVTGELSAAKRQLEEIAALFGDEVQPEEVKGKVEEMLALLESATAGGDGDKGKDDTGGSMSLADALASLDDADDSHWTQGGLPAMAALEVRTGKDVSRAEVDALPEAQRRVRKTA